MHGSAGLSQDLTRLKSRYHPRLASRLRLWALSHTHMVVGKIHFLAGVELRGLQGPQEIISDFPCVLPLDSLLRAHLGTSLVVQWLRLCASNARVTGSIPGWGTRIPHAAGMATIKSPATEGEERERERERERES